MSLSCIRPISTVDRNSQYFWNSSEFSFRCMYVSIVTQSCLTLCDPMDCSPPGGSSHGIFQTRMLEWVAIPYSRGSSWPRNWTWVCHIAGETLYYLSHQGSMFTKCCYFYFISFYPPHSPTRELYSFWHVQILFIHIVGLPDTLF